MVIETRKRSAFSGRPDSKDYISRSQERQWRSEHNTQALEETDAALAKEFSGLTKLPTITHLREWAKDKTLPSWLTASNMRTRLAGTIFCSAQAQLNNQLLKQFRKLNKTAEELERKQAEQAAAIDSITDITEETTAVVQKHAEDIDTPYEAVADNASGIAACKESNERCLRLIAKEINGLKKAVAANLEVAAPIDEGEGEEDEGEDEDEDEVTIFDDEEPSFVVDEPVDEEEEKEAANDDNDDGEFNLGNGSIK